MLLPRQLKCSDIARNGSATLSLKCCNFFFSFLQDCIGFCLEFGKLKISISLCERRGTSYAFRPPFSLSTRKRTDMHVSILINGYKMILNREETVVEGETKLLYFNEHG